MALAFELDEKLVVIPHDGTFKGDNPFWIDECLSFPYEPGMTLDMVKNRTRELDWVKEYNSDDEKEIDEFVNDVVGAWIVSDQIFSDISEKLGNFESGGDSGDYAMNNMEKSYVAACAVGFIGEELK